MKFKSTSKMIDRVTANKEINENISLSNTEKALIKNQMPNVNPMDQNAFKNFTQSKFNAFVFPVNDIVRFLKKDPNNSESGQCEYLMVIIGSHFEDSGPFRIGTQTVIISGVNEIETKDNQPPAFATLDIPHPGQEYPPQIVISSLPDSNIHGGTNSLQFTIQ